MMANYILIFGLGIVIGCCVFGYYFKSTIRELRKKLQFELDENERRTRNTIKRLKIPYK